MVTRWYNVYGSPWIRPKIRVNFYKDIRCGTPYFYPRRTISSIEAKWYNLLSKIGAGPLRPTAVGSADNVYVRGGWKKGMFKNAKYFNIKILDLGYKTKWSSTDYRYEWDPMISIVLFGTQTVITFEVPESAHYWESWLYYHRDTDHSLSKEERLKQTKENFKLLWSSGFGESKITTDYYNTVLDKKYR